MPINFLETFVAYCHSYLLKSRENEGEGYSYLLGRGVSDKQIEDFKIGFFEGDIPVREENQEFNNFNRWARYGKQIQRRLIFPFYNSKGLLRGIETRKIDEKNYLKFALERSSADGVFFGLPHALPEIWKTKSVIIVEGIFDFFPIQRIFPNTICCMTAKVSPNQFKMLERYGKNIHVLFDSDKPGQQLAQVVVDRLKKQNVQLYSLPGHDIGDIWQKFGEDRFKQFLTLAINQTEKIDGAE
jgi:DNA primase